MKYSYENEWKYIKVNDNITNFERPTGSAATGSQQTTQSGQKATQSATQHGQKPTSSATTGSMSVSAEESQRYSENSRSASLQLR